MNPLVFDGPNLQLFFNGTTISQQHYKESEAYHPVFIYHLYFPTHLRHSFIIPSGLSSHIYLMVGQSLHQSAISHPIQSPRAQPSKFDSLNVRTITLCFLKVEPCIKHVSCLEQQKKCTQQIVNTYLVDVRGMEK